MDGLIHRALFRQAGALPPSGQLGRGHLYTKKSTTQLFIVLIALSPVKSAPTSVSRVAIVELLRGASCAASGLGKIFAHS